MKSLFSYIILINSLISFDPSSLTTEQIYHFYDNSEQEKLKNLNLANTEVRQIEDQYTQCVISLKDTNFTKEEIDSCLGEDFEKLTQSFDFVRMKIQAQGEQLII